MLGFFSVRKARNAAMATVPSFIDYTKRRYSTDQISLEIPFVAGFVTIFITNSAYARVHRLSEDMLGIIQADVWASILDTGPDLIGEQISFQSARADPTFISGCANAHYFCRDLFSAIHIRELEALARLFCIQGHCNDAYFHQLCSGNERRENLMYKWSYHFEDHL